MEHVKPKEILALLHRQGFRCAYTGQPLTPETTGADHKIPTSRGGSNGIDNLALTLRTVNAAKGAMTLEEFREMCSRVVAHLGAVETEADDTAVEELSGACDPVEILARLGYVQAAEEVRQLKLTLTSKLTSIEDMKRRRVNDSGDCECGTKRAQIDELQRKIASLQCKKTQLRRDTGHKARYAREEEVSI
jgi:polyhydroxyalkanoate synthesis regulator phasin